MRVRSPVNAQAHISDAALSEPLYRTGTLVYTRRGLLILSAWLLWGDFAFYFFESIFMKFIPIYFKDLQASNTLIGIMTGSFAGLVNILFLPSISRWSDNFRSRIGRRIPFLYVTAPLTVISLAAVGFAPEIGGILHRFLPPPLMEGMSLTALILGLLCGFVVSFHFFNMVLVNGYNWLIRDLVPLEVMSRFLAWFRIVGNIAGVFFLWFVFPYLTTYRREIFLGVGVFYLVIFITMCLKVKEGAYPPPDPNRPTSVLKNFRQYFTECLQEPLYRNFFIAYMLLMAAISCAAPFGTLFARETLGMNLDDLGRVYAMIAVIGVVIYYPIGWICDRYSPLHVMLGSFAALAITSLAAQFLIHTSSHYLVYLIVYSFPNVAFSLSNIAAAMKLFPTGSFGQFSSGLSVFGCGGLIAGNFIIGVIIDYFHDDYRLNFAWTAVFAGTAIIPMLRVFRHWRAHGGPDCYIPPLPRP